MKFRFFITNLNNKLQDTVDIILVKNCHLYHKKEKINVYLFMLINILLCLLVLFFFNVIKYFLLKDKTKTNITCTVIANC